MGKNQKINSTHLYFMVNNINNNMAKLWTPIFLPFGSLTNWYDSTDTTTLTLSTGDTVADWRDKSYDANDLSEADFADLPLYGTTNINGLSTVDFDGGTAVNLDDNSVNTPTDSNSNLYIIYVGFNNTWTQTSTMFNFTNVAGDSMLLRNGGATTTQLLIKKGAAFNLNTNITKPNDNRTVIYTIDCTDSSDVTLELNYTNAQTTSRNIANSPGLYTSLTLGAQSIDLNGLNGQAGEFVVVQQANMTLEDKQKLEGYTAWKWGQVANLPGGHPYETAAPTVTDVEFRNKLYETSTEEGTDRFRRLFELGFVG